MSKKIKYNQVVIGLWVSFFSVPSMALPVDTPLSNKTGAVATVVAEPIVTHNTGTEIKDIFPIKNDTISADPIPTSTILSYKITDPTPEKTITGAVSWKISLDKIDESYSCTFKVEYDGRKSNLTVTNKGDKMDCSSTDGVSFSFAKK